MGVVRPKVSLASWSIFGTSSSAVTTWSIPRTVAPIKGVRPYSSFVFGLLPAFNYSATSSFTLNLRLLPRTIVFTLPHP
ncbi:uncharacterized protein EURHEDRAFT_548500 [Aspergillus ruber CBS 135680]|uniref:Uncharacterized protein n=1 Tax=Aspergillus ruber (strain CBS 135680) TaxID=1388766 RepID=A0A017S3Z7_ASPRC|nr:uncharacterized protein EURHEDRAFT_548500 [Aspergillus ruber CBS 135680]EYE90915.1 hypothetical protein EURHEDRAFT_548500 [Aspergillus ruber CBS 135680]